MLSKQRIDCRSVAVERHEDHVHPGKVLEHFERDVLGARRPDAGERQLAGSRARRIEHLCEAAIRRGPADHHHLRGGHQLADRLEACQGIVGEFSQVWIDDEGISVEQHRVAVGHGTGRRFGRNYGPGARAVLNQRSGNCRTARFARSPRLRGVASVSCRKCRRLPSLVSAISRQKSGLARSCRPRPLPPRWPSLQGG